jgi:hypothetical protein
MAISSVGAAGTTLQQQLVTAKTPQLEYPEQTRAQDEASRPSEPQATNVETVQARAAQAPERAEQPERTEQPKTYVNAQGQKTGTIINVTA